MQKHGARLIRGDKTAIILEDIKREYGVEYCSGVANKKADTIPYVDAYNSAVGPNGNNRIRFLMDVLRDSRLLTKTYGRSRYMIRSIGRMYLWYPEAEMEVKNFLSRYLRPITATQYKANAVTRYPMLDPGAACSLFMEDLLVENLGLQQKHTVDEKGKIIEIPVAV